MTWLVQNTQFWLVVENSFWLVIGLGLVRSDSGLLVCDWFFAVSNNRLFPGQGSFISDPEMKGARFNMVINICNFSFELLFYEAVCLIFFDKSLWYMLRIVKMLCLQYRNRVGQSREIYSNSVPLSPSHWPYPKRIRPPSWPRVAVASSIQNTKLFTWRTWPGAGAVPKCDWAARSQCGFKQRRAYHTKYI